MKIWGRLPNNSGGLQYKFGCKAGGVQLKSGVSNENL